MKKLSLGVLLALAVIALAQPAVADTCTFQGSCLRFSRNCDFQATGSCTNGANPTFSWECFDPPAFYTGATITHDFNDGVAASSCKLTCTCAGNPQTTTTLQRFTCFSIGVPGCIFPDQGYN